MFFFLLPLVYHNLMSVVWTWASIFYFHSDYFGSNSSSYSWLLWHEYNSKVVLFDVHLSYIDEA